MADTIPDRISFFKSFFDAAIQLPTTEEQNALLAAVPRFVFGGELPEFSNSAMKMCWTLMEPNIKKSAKLVVEGSANGKRGGRPKGSTKASTKRAPKKGTLSKDAKGTSKADISISSPIPTPHPNESGELYMEDNHGNMQPAYTPPTDPYADQLAEEYPERFAKQDFVF